MVFTLMYLLTWCSLHSVNVFSIPVCWPPTELIDMETLPSLRICDYAQCSHLRWTNRGLFALPQNDLVQRILAARVHLEPTGLPVTCENNSFTMLCNNGRYVGRIIALFKILTSSWSIPVKLKSLVNSVSTSMEL